MDQKSLEERCLQVVANHIDRFSYAFNTTSDDVLKRNFEYLQFCYSDELQQIISELDIVKEEYFPLFINKYMRELNLSILDQVDGKTIIQILADIGEGLTEISFSTRRAFYRDPRFTDVFPHLKNLTILSMEHTCNDEALRNIAEHCPYLIELNIAYSIVTNEGLRRYLCQKDEKSQVPNLNLRKLNLDGTDVNDNLTALILMSFPQLEILKAPSMPCILHKMHQEDLDQKNFSNVKKFKLTHLDALFCTHLTSSPELLKFFAFVCPDVSDLTAVVNDPDQLNALTIFTKLKNVTLNQDELFPQPIVNKFLNSIGARLTVLKLDGFSLSVDQLLKCCPLLVELQLKNSLFLRIEVEVAPKELKFLKSICLEDAHFKNAAMAKSLCAILYSASKLEKIVFRRCRFFSDEIKDVVANCCIRCPLKSVYFSDSDFYLPLLQSILLSSCTLKLLRIENPKFLTPVAHLNQANIELLSDIASNVLNKPVFQIEGEEIDFNAAHDLDIFHNMYREANWGIY